MNENLDSSGLDRVLASLAFRLEENGAGPVEIVVCGGSALILGGMVARATKDVDIVALLNDGALCSPDPLPDELRKAAREVGEDLALPRNWLNNAVSRGEGGLFQMGLPAGLSERLRSKTYGPRLRVHFIDRTDQIHFKLYAAVDRGGYHVEDLRALKPASAEIEAAARWAMTHDVSEGFRMVLRRFLKEFGYANVAERF